jgi:hypothetical protein
MIASRSFAFALLLLVACTRESPRPAARARPPAAQTTAPEQRPITTPTTDSATAPAVEDVAPTPPPAVAEAGPQTFEGDGIQVELGDDQSVTVRTTDLWDASVNLHYDSCVYARAAVPVLRRTLGDERAALIERACGPFDPDAGPPPVVGGRGVRPVVRPAARPPMRRAPVRGGGA